MQFIDGKVKMAIISSDFQGSVTDSVTSNQVETSSHHIELDQWWHVTYDGEVFTGEVTKWGKTKWMQSVGHHGTCQQWKWPKEKDEIYYKLPSFVSFATVANSRGHLNLMKTDCHS